MSIKSTLCCTQLLDISGCYEPDPRDPWEIPVLFMFSLQSLTLASLNTHKPTGRDSQLGTSCCLSTSEIPLSRWDTGSQKPPHWFPWLRKEGIQITCFQEWNLHACEHLRTAVTLSCGARQSPHILVNSRWHFFIRFRGSSHGLHHWQYAAIPWCPSPSLWSIPLGLLPHCPHLLGPLWRPHQHCQSTKHLNLK